MHRPAKTVSVLLATIAALGQLASAAISSGGPKGGSPGAAVGLTSAASKRLPTEGEWSVEGTKTLQGPGILYLEQRVVSRGNAAAASGSILLRLVLPDPKHCVLRVVDNPGGQRSLGQAMEANNCLAGVNGGYFRPDFSPVGLEIADGRMIHPKETAKLITGMVVVHRGGRVSLLRVGEYKPSPAILEALQCGPFLVDREKPVAGLNASKRAYRTVVLSNGAGGFGLVMAESVTLADMAQILATPGLLHGMKITRALNLDGGTSSGLWVREPSLYEREFKRVRNFLAVVPAAVK